jgi:hypothetical protein
MESIPCQRILLSMARRSVSRIEVNFHTTPEHVFHQGGINRGSASVDSHWGGRERKNTMFNPVDTRQVRALVDHKREQVAADAARVRQAIEPARASHQDVGRVRIAVGVRLMRVGARIAGGYSQQGPHFHPGV